MGLTPAENRQANVLTGLSIPLSIALVIIAIWLNIKWAMCFWMILAGIIIHCGINLIGLAIVRPVLQNFFWAIVTI